MNASTPSIRNLLRLGMMDRVGPDALLQPASVTPDVSLPEHLGLSEAERTYTMFIQTAKAGTWEPKDEEEGVYTLTLTGLPAETVYFSDRPSRIVGIQSTADFLEALGFGKENPPNAALVTKADNGQDDILVIELFNAVYTENGGESGATLVYNARILENYHETGLGRVALQQVDTAIPESFEGASLFIDDCSDGEVLCKKGSTVYGAFPYGCCYKFPACHQCHDITGICDVLAGCENGQCDIVYRQECWIY